MAEQTPVDNRTYDPGKFLTHAALYFVGALIIFVGSIIAAQIWQTGEANTESWAALTGLIGWACGTASSVFNARFGTSQQSAAKDATIAQQARTAERATKLAAAVQETSTGTGASADGSPGQGTGAQPTTIIRGDANIKAEGAVNVSPGVDHET